MFTKIGHRGAMGYAPENSLKSFKKALELNVDMIELDVHLCKSGELIVIHDKKVDRTTNGKGYVTHKTLDEIKMLDIDGGEKIPLLSEVFDLVDKKVKINVELKGKNTAEAVNDLIQKYVKNRGWKYEQFLISSFNRYELKRFHKLNPDVEIGVLIKESPDYRDILGFARMINAGYAHIFLRFINSDFVNTLHKNGLKVYVWTVNSVEDIERMKRLNVDGIFSDFPDRL